MHHITHELDQVDHTRNSLATSEPRDPVQEAEVPARSDSARGSGAPATSDQQVTAELAEGELVSVFEHHYIPRSQKVYEHIPTFVRQHLADLAANVSHN